MLRKLQWLPISFLAQFKDLESRYKLLPIKSGVGVPEGLHHESWVLRSVRRVFFLGPPSAEGWLLTTREVFPRVALQCWNFLHREGCPALPLHAFRWHVRAELCSRLLMYPLRPFYLALCWCVCVCFDSCIVFYPIIVVAILIASCCGQGTNLTNK